MHKIKLVNEGGFLPTKQAVYHALCSLARVSYLWIGRADLMTSNVRKKIRVPTSSSQLHVMKTGDKLF